MSSPRPGWYPDPAGPSSGFRWWDGSGWTAEVSATANVPAPLAAPDTTRPTGQDARRGGGVPTGPAGLRPGTVGKDRRRRVGPVRLGVALALGLVLLGTAAVVLSRSGAPAATAGAGRATTPATRGWVSPSATAVSSAEPSASDSQPMGHVDLRSGVAMIGSTSMTLPTERYAIEPASLSLPGLFDVFFIANAPVHPRYNGSDDWSATVGLAHIPRSVVAGADLRGTATVALTRMAPRFFGGHRTTAEDLQMTATTVSGQQACEATVAMAYAIPKLPSTRDLVHVVLVALPDGSAVIAVSSVPADAAAAVHELAARSLASLTVG